MKPMRAKKSLGQHFLRSTRALNKIVEAANITPGDVVLEIGPGKGALTQKLVDAGARVIAVEKDDRCIGLLDDAFATTPEEQKPIIIHGDILDENIQKILFSKKHLGTVPYKLVANIPYYITGRLFRLFLEKLRQPSSLTFLIQKEVAEQIVSRDGKEGILSLSIKTYGQPRYVGKVGRDAFAPPPKVDSAIIHVADISRERLGTLSDEDFFRILKAGFRARRKKLLGNLRDGLLLPKETLEQIFMELAINPDIRGEDLALPHWITLSKKIAQIKHLSK